MSLILLSSGAIIGATPSGNRAQTDATISTASYWAQASVKTGAANATDMAGVFARATDIDNNYFTYIAGDGNVYLYSVSGQLGSAVIAGFSASTYYSLRLECGGAQIRVLIDSTEKISVTNTEHTTTGSVGLYMQNTNARITSFRIRQIASVTESATVADSPLIGAGIGLSANESITVSDSPSISSILGLTISESITIVDSPTIASVLDLSVSETMTVVVSPIVSSVMVISISETITVVDVPFVDGIPIGISINESESIIVVDSPTIASTFSISTNESITIVDSPSIGSALGMTVNESMTVAQAVSSGMALQPVTVGETLVFVDSGTIQITIQNIDTLFISLAKTRVFTAELKTKIFTSET